MAVDKFHRLIFFWANKASRLTPANYVVMSSKTVSRIFSRIESICSPKMRNTFAALKFGSKLRFCEVDEAKMRKPKYNRGTNRYKKEMDIRCIWDGSPHSGYCVPVPNRNYPNCAHITRKDVSKGSVLYSD